MNISLDVDGTISRLPKLFAVLSHAVRASGGKIIVVTSRSNTPEVWDTTRRELRSYGVEYDELFVIPDGTDRIPCPHASLDWYQQYLWQKVHVCLVREVDAVFEDDPKVINLFKAYAPDIQVFRLD